MPTQTAITIAGFIVALATFAISLESTDFSTRKLGIPGRGA